MNMETSFVAVQIEATSELCASGLVVSLTDAKGAVISEVVVAPGVRLVCDATGIRSELIGWPT